ncbi:fatty acid synthase [Stachybotrys elegans]|uniref:Fatty acid synthase n=1 Tax=Stachybotrys elegans TaxID=80388 RepID=A0A8K0SHS5_9HYPO|nr:fatty acid synthase [Stachybotrys elegans]
MWMDPQQRKLLEVVYEAFESAGVTLDALSGSKTAVFAASFTADFQQMAFKEPAFRHSLAATGVDPGILSNRISHVFNLKGPSIVECVAAVVGGVNLVMTVDQHMNTAKLGVLSPTSTCHTFDASADGYGRAEAVGAVYLKLLSDALRDGDPIRAVIRSSATNNNGKVPAVGITHPNREGQAEVITHAYHRGGNLDPRMTGFFECHGTGTAVGDPLEVNAVSMAMNRQRSPSEEPLMIGAVKTNVGHSGAASGISALIKAVLSVKRGIIPPTRGVVNPSPAIKWKEWMVTVPTEPTPFPDLPLKRFSINSFGYGGTNAHVIVESADALLTRKQTYKYLSGEKKAIKNPRGAFNRNRPYLFLFSAHDKGALERNFAAHGLAAKGYNFLDLAYTLGNRRTVFPTRGFIVAKQASLKDGKLSDLVIGSKKKVPVIGFIFTGQGAQYARMGAELMSYYPSFLRSIRMLDNTLGELPHVPEWTLEDMLLMPSETSRVNEAEYSQPLTTAVQIALVQLLRAWGVNPAVTCGHSSGEIAAAYAAGLISASDAITLAYYRGYVVRDINTGGSMMAVGLGAGDVEPYLTNYAGKIVIACHNSPAGVTLSGDEAAISELHKTLADEGVFARHVKTNGKAYHSPLMAPASARYEEYVRQAKSSLLPFDIPISTDAKMLSSVTNDTVPAGSTLDESYFSRNLRQPVLFNQAVQTILTDPEFADVNLLIEIGPHGALGGPIRQIKQKLNASELDYLPTMVRGEDSAMQMLKLAGELFLRDYPLDIDRVTSIEETTSTGKVVCKRGDLIVDLPPYQWEHRQPKYPRHDLLGSLIPGVSLVEPTWRNFLRIRDLPWLKDHSLGGEAVFPAVAYFSMAMEAVTQISELQDPELQLNNFVLRDISIKKALVTPEDDTGVEVLFNLRPTVFSVDGKWWDFNVSSVDQDGIATDHMTGSISANMKTQRPASRPKVNLTQKTSGKEWNQALRAVGFDYGPVFADMTDIGFNGRDYICTCKTQVKQVSGDVVGESRHVLHPGTVDSTLQLMIASIYAGRTKAMSAAIAPIQVDEVCIWKPTEEQIGDGYATAWTDDRGTRTFVCGNELVSGTGEVLMQMRNMRGTLYEAAVPQSSSTALKPMPYSEMVWKEDVDSLTSAANVEGLVELAVFKNPSVKVLDVGGNYATTLLPKFPTLSYVAVAEGSEPEGLTSTHPSASWKLVDMKKSFTDQGLSEGSFDLILSSSDDVSSVSNLLSDNGRIAFKTGEGLDVGLAPKAKKLNEGEIEVQLLYRQLEAGFLTEIQRSFAARGVKTKPVSLQQLEAVQPHVVLFDLDEPILFKLSEHEFSMIKKVCSDQDVHPAAGMIAGLVRSIRAEQTTINIVTIDVDMETTTVPQAVDFITQKSQNQITDAANVEHEYCVSDGRLYISRLLPSHGLNKEQEIQELPYDPEMRISGTVKTGRVFFEQETSSSSIGPDSIEIRVEVSSLSKEGILAVHGTDISTTLNHEFGGTMARIGSSVESVAVGDRVVALGSGKFGNHQVVSKDLLVKALPEESLTELVSLPLAYVTALYGLKSLASTQKNENVLILEGTGLGGAAAIEVALNLGAIPYVVASSESQASSIMQRYGLQEHQVLSSSKQVEELLTSPHRMSNIDVVFSSGMTPESSSRETWRYINRFGRFVDCGKKLVLKRGSRDPVPFYRGATYYSFDVVELCEHKSALVSGLLKEAIGLYREGSVSPLQPLNVINIADLNKVITGFTDDIGTGKTIISYEPSETALSILPSVETTAFSPDATYLLVGCLGGLGRSLTAWMMEKGARNFCFLSRSGAGAPQAARLVVDLEIAGATVEVVRGDVGVQTDIMRAVAGISPDRPLRGVIQAAMVLRDGIFQNMSFQDWVTSTNAKVHGTANLQSVLGDMPLDLFLMTSSISGTLGTPGQSNYAAGNAFLDALAHHRRNKGQNACAVVVPMVLGVGVVAESTDLEDSLKRKGMYGIDEEHLLRSFDIAIHEQQNQRSGDSRIHQLVMGLDPSLLARAIDDCGEENVDAFWMADKRFRSLVKDIETVNGGASVGGGTSALGSMLAAATPEEAMKIARDEIVGKLSRMLLLDLEVFEGDAGSIASYGIDSMIGAELRNWLFKEFAIEIPFQQLLGPTLTAIKLARQLCVNHGILQE